MKQVLVMRADLNMSPGKLAAQAAHAAILAYNHAPISYIEIWKRHGVTKVVLAVDSEAELLELYKKATAEYLSVALITDEGRTEVVPGTITCIGIGPAPDENINKVTGHLRLYGKEKNDKTD